MGCTFKVNSGYRSLFTFTMHLEEPLVSQPSGVITSKVFYILGKLHQNFTNNIKLHLALDFLHLRADHTTDKKKFDDDVISSCQEDDE